MNPPAAGGRWVCGAGGPVGVALDGCPAGLDSGRYVSWRWGWAPTGLATRRQLSAMGLRPGGAEPVGQIVWRRGRRHAALYRIDLARPKRAMTPAKWAALAKAHTARRTCPTCTRIADYVIPTSLGACLDCTDSGAPEHDWSKAA